MRTKMKVIAILSLALLAASCRAKAEEIHGLDDFDDPNQIREIQQLEPYFEKLSKKLHKKLFNQPREVRVNPEKVLEFARDKLGSFGCTGHCLDWNKLIDGNKDKALALFLSLQNTVDRCDRTSYDILAKNYMIHQILPFAYIDAEETYEVFNHYHAKHAKFCRKIHRDRFNEAIEKVTPDTLNKLTSVFSELNIYDFGYDGETNPYMNYHFDLVGMEKPNFTRFHGARRALKRIACQLKKIGLEVYPSQEEFRRALDDNLFEPCNEFRKQLATILDEARFDAAVEDGLAQRNFLHEDTRFNRALIHNRLCGSLLKDRDQMHKLLAEVWHEDLYERN